MPRVRWLVIAASLAVGSAACGNASRGPDATARAFIVDLNKGNAKALANDLYPWPGSASVAHVIGANQLLPWTVRSVQVNNGVRPPDDRLTVVGNAGGQPLTVRLQLSRRGSRWYVVIPATTPNVEVPFTPQS